MKCLDVSIDWRDMDNLASRTKDQCVNSVSTDIDDNNLSSGCSLAQMARVLENSRTELSDLLQQTFPFPDQTASRTTFSANIFYTIASDLGGLRRVIKTVKRSFLHPPVAQSFQVGGPVLVPPLSTLPSQFTGMMLVAKIRIGPSC
ncbi:hypothetical protein PILCRDRAFT_815893 [Piloderma croceum F 1598]|uniref:Uncharacterized protein n=1 Tax=Piloderma croceum (strain F 1598) TaxID=765440 RepID=A0A0C3CAE9_PILCF|nr:hypothetical protein PILCRDRAFT_815893 [Piloderma croceum F 1598]